jgi:hypothetical protein
LHVVHHLLAMSGFRDFGDYLFDGSQPSRLALFVNKKTLLQTQLQCAFDINHS